VEVGEAGIVQVEQVEQRDVEVAHRAHCKVWASKT
jgi:hypothetical protein